MSLSTRLSLFFLAALALVLGGFSVSLYLLARLFLARQVEVRLESALDALAAVVEREPDGLTWEPDEHHLALGQDARPYQVRWEVRDSRGELVGKSANLGPDGFGKRAARTGVREIVEREGQPWELQGRRLVAESTALKENEKLRRSGRHATLLLTAGVDLQPYAALLRRLALILAVLSTGLWVVAAVGGRWVSRRVLSPLRRMAGSARGISAADLSERLPDPGTRDELADLSRAFNDLLARLEEAFARQRQFTGDASHQLRTPLAGLLGQLEVALRRDRSGEEYRQTLSLAHDQAAHLRRVVEALLFLARADAEADTGALETLDLTAWLPEYLRPWARQARASDLRLELPGAGSLPVRAQPALLGQLLDNLVENAFKHTGPGTAVGIAVQQQAEAVAVSVEDAGPGISLEDLPHVFEPFYRSAEARRRGLPGAGLGLAVARRIAAAFGGALFVESQVGKGTKFTILLPAASFSVADGAGTKST
jgi:two-component system OmpR family sensor kinase